MDYIIGFLAAFAILLILVIVVGVVTIFKDRNRITDIENQIPMLFDQLVRSIDEVSTEAKNLDWELKKSLEAYVDGRVDKTINTLQKNIDDVSDKIRSEDIRLERVLKEYIDREVNA